MTKGMSKTELYICNRKFDFMCSEEDTDHIHGLAETLNERIEKISKNIQASSDIHIIAMAAIIIEDELQTLKKSIANNSAGNNNPGRQEEQPSEPDNSVQKPYISIENHQKALNMSVSKTLTPIVNYLEKLINNLEST